MALGDPLWDMNKGRVQILNYDAKTKKWCKTHEKSVGTSLSTLATMSQEGNRYAVGAPFQPILYFNDSYVEVYEITDDFSKL